MPGSKMKACGFQATRYRDLNGKLVGDEKREGLSQKALAQRLGRHQQFVSRYEIGERRFDVVEFANVAKSLGEDAASTLAAFR